MEDMESDPEKIAFLLYSPLNQGLKLLIAPAIRETMSVFTLQSIKSRIETSDRQNKVSGQFVFLLYSPLNQGLKHPKDRTN